MSTTVLAIDGGGSSTRAKAISDGEIVFERVGGRANLRSTPRVELTEALRALTDGCPAPSVVAGCFAGLGGGGTADLAGEILRGIFPDAQLRLAGDHVAALLASPDADAVLIAGTGSTIISRTLTGVATTGGLGHLIGDRGSAFRYGQLLLEQALLRGVDAMPHEVGSALEETFGTTDRSGILTTTYTSIDAPRLLARLAPALTRLAAEGEAWAMDAVDQETRVLADETSQHLTRHVAALHEVTIDLAGGVWNSETVARSFAHHLHNREPDRHIAVRRASRPPIAGAVTLASLADHQIGGLVRIIQTGGDR